MATWARVGLVVYAVAVTANDVLFWVHRQAERQVFHFQRQLWVALVHGRHLHQTAPPNPNGWVGFVFEPVTLAGLIVFLVWQCRSAKVARALGYPARRSPVWGAWSWVVPIVNFWMPYQAVRDCVPPDHPLRPTVLRAWLLVLVVGVPACRSRSPWPRRSRWASCSSCS